MKYISIRHIWNLANILVIFETKFPVVTPPWRVASNVFEGKFHLEVPVGYYATYFSFENPSNYLNGDANADSSEIESPLSFESERVGKKARPLEWLPNSNLKKHLERVSKDL